MRCSILLTLIGTCCVVLPQPAMAADAVCWGIESFSSSYAADGLHLQFSLGDGPVLYNDAPSSYCWSTDVFAVDVFRQRLHGPCAALERITDTPLPWVNQPGAPHITTDLIDDDVEPNTAYQYFVRPVCCQDFPAVMIGCASTGVALISRGTLTTDLPWPGNYISPCDNSCLAADVYGRAALVTSRPPEADPYFNTPTTVVIYGEFDGLVLDPCNLCNHFPGGQDFQRRRITLYRRGRAGNVGRGEGEVQVTPGAPSKGRLPPPVPSLAGPGRVRPFRPILDSRSDFVLIYWADVRCISGVI